MPEPTFTFGRLIVLSFLIAFTYSKTPVFKANEKSSIDKLRTAVEVKLVMKYMKSDAYLYKWLKAKNFDHRQALEALEKTLEWRKEAKIDNLPFENHDKLAKKYVIDFTTARDKEGHPVILIPFGDWDIRRKAIQGALPDIGRRLDLMEEKGAQLAFNETGDPTSMIIADVQGFSLKKHACAGCFAIYLYWVGHHENHYPYNMYRVITINTPSMFDPIVTLMRPLMTDSTRVAFKTMGHNRGEYSSLISETVDLKVLPYRFGGTKKSGK